MTYVKGAWVDDDGSGTTGTFVTKSRMDNIEQGIADAHIGLAPPPLVSALPTGSGLVEGKVVRLQASESFPAVWTMCYRPKLADGSANPASSKWDFMGGPEMMALRDIGASQIANNNVWEVIGTTDLQLTVPFTGYYDVDYQLNGQADSAGVFDTNAAVMKQGTSVALFGSGNDSWGRANYQFQTLLLAARGRVALTQGDVIQVKGLCIFGAGAVWKWYNGRLGLKPVRLA